MNSRFMFIFFQSFDETTRTLRYEWLIVSKIVLNLFLRLRITWEGCYQYQKTSGHTRMLGLCVLLSHRVYVYLKNIHLLIMFVFLLRSFWFDKLTICFLIDFLLFIFFLKLVSFNRHSILVVLSTKTHNHISITTFINEGDG